MHSGALCYLKANSYHATSKMPFELKLVISDFLRFPSREKFIFNHLPDIPLECDSLHDTFFQRRCVSTSPMLWWRQFIWGKFQTIVGKSLSSLRRKNLSQSHSLSNIWLNVRLLIPWHCISYVYIIMVPGTTFWFPLLSNNSLVRHPKPEIYFYVENWHIIIKFSFKIPPSTSSVKIV